MSDAMTINLPPRIAENITQFTGRAWLLSPLLDWLEKSDDRLFLLTGGPGTGKSMIMAWLAGYGPLPTDATRADQLAHLRRRVKAVHFCIANSGSTDPKALASELARQLTRYVPGFSQALAATLGEQVRIAPEQHVEHVESGGSVTGVYIASLNLGGLSEELSFNRILRDPLKRLYEDGYKEPMLLLVDALDEALTYTGSANIVHLLAKLTDLPPQVRILATTRPEPRVTKLFSEVPRFDLIKNAPENVDDVTQYILERLPTQDGPEEEKRTLLATRLSEKAGGIFLYAYMVLGDLLPHLPQIPDLEAYPLPDGLSGLYHDFLNRELGKDEDRWYASFRPILGLITVAQGAGLTSAQLAAITGKEVEQPLRKCKQYLNGELPAGPFRVFHQSFAEFLLQDDENVDYHVDATTMHQWVFDYYSQTYGPNWLRCDDYGWQFLAFHAAALADTSRIHDLLTSRFIDAQASRSLIQLLHDLRLGISSAIGAGATEILYLFRYALLEGALRTFAASLPHPVFVALEVLQYRQHVMDLVSLIADPLVRIDKLIPLLELRFSSDLQSRHEDVSTIQGELRALANYKELVASRKDWRIYHSLNSLSSALIARLGQLDAGMAEHLVNSEIDDPYYQSMALENIAKLVVLESAQRYLQYAWDMTNHIGGLGGYRLERKISIAATLCGTDPNTAREKLQLTWTEVTYSEVDGTGKQRINISSMGDRLAICQCMRNIDPELAEQWYAQIWWLVLEYDGPKDEMAEYCRRLFLAVRDFLPNLTSEILNRLRTIASHLRTRGNSERPSESLNSQTLHAEARATNDW